MENPAYSRDGDEDARESLNGLQNDSPNNMAAQPGKTPPGGQPTSGRAPSTRQPKQQSEEQEEVIEPVIVRSTAAPSGALYSPRRGSYNRLDEGADIDYKKNTLWNIAAQDGARPPPYNDPESRASSAQSNTSKKSVIEHVDEPDDFPWQQPKRKDSSFDTIDLEDPNVITTHDLSAERRRSSAIASSAGDKPPSKWKKFKIWWRNLEQKMQDNRVNTPEEKRELLLLDQQQDSQYRKVKKALNVVFLLAGFVLLLAVIVHIINTDPQFNETMKALTVFLAGRRQGIW